MDDTQTMLKTTNPVFVMITLFTSLIYPIAQAQTPQAQPIAKTSACPSGYATSGNYCKPGNNARFSIEKQGACPSGYSSSGGYCLAGSSAKPAIHKQGSCPSGWSTSGDFCLLSH